MWRAAIALVAGSVALSGCAALGPVGAPRPVATDARGADILADGCGQATPGLIEGLGMSREFKRLEWDWDATPIGAPGSSVFEITPGDAREADLGVTMPELPGGLAVHRIDTQKPIHAVNYFLTKGPLDGAATYPGVLAGGGAVLRVERNANGVDVTERLLRQAEEEGWADQVGIVNVAGSNALLGQGDQRGELRTFTIIWSDDQHEFNLDTAFESGAAVVNLARAIGCAQA